MVIRVTSVYVSERLDKPKTATEEKAPQKQALSLFLPNNPNKHTSLSYPNNPYKHTSFSELCSLCLCRSLLSSLITQSFSWIHSLTHISSVRVPKAKPGARRVSAKVKSLWKLLDELQEFFRVIRVIRAINFIRVWFDAICKFSCSYEQWHAYQNYSSWWGHNTSYASKRVFEGLLVY